MTQLFCTIAKPITASERLAEYEIVSVLAGQVTLRKAYLADAPRFQVNEMELTTIWDSNGEQFPTPADRMAELVQPEERPAFMPGMPDEDEREHEEQLRDWRDEQAMYADLRHGG